MRRFMPLREKAKSILTERVAELGEEKSRIESEIESAVTNRQMKNLDKELRFLVKNYQMNKYILDGIS